MLGWCAVLIKVYFFWKKTIALLHLLHYCNSFLGGKLLHIAIFNSFFSHYCYCNSSDGYCQCLVPYIVENGKIQWNMKSEYLSAFESSSRKYDRCRGN